MTSYIFKEKIGPSRQWKSSGPKIRGGEKVWQDSRGRQLVVQDFRRDHMTEDGCHPRLRLAVGCRMGQRNCRSECGVSLRKPVFTALKWYSQTHRATLHSIQECACSCNKRGQIPTGLNGTARNTWCLTPNHCGQSESASSLTAHVVLPS